MKIIVVALALSALALGHPTAAAAAAPKISGTYGFMIWGQCTAKLSAPFEEVLIPPISKPETDNAIREVDNPQPGLLSVTVGTMTLTPSTPNAAAGTVTGSNTQVGGGVVQVNNNGNPMQTSLGSISGTYSFTDATFTLVLHKGGTQIFAMSFGGVDDAGIAHSIYLVRQGAQGGNQYCLQAINATRQ